MSTESKKDKPTRVTLEWTPQEIAAFDIVEQIEPFASLGASRRTIIRYLLITCAQNAHKGNIEPATKADIDELMTLMKGIAMVARTSASSTPTFAPVPAKRGPKPKEVAAQEAADERIEDGMNICQALGGTVAGAMCIYKKYEVMATGRPVSFDLSEPLAVLGSSHLSQQFDPSREAYDRSVREYKESE